MELTFCATRTYALRRPGLTLEPMPDERPGQRTAHSRRAYVLAVLIRDGGAYALRENAPGDGTGVAVGRLRFVVEFDAAEFWRKWAEVAGAKGWTYKPGGRPSRPLLDPANPLG